MLRRLAHVIHVGEDVGALNRWYHEQFGVTGFMGWPEPHYLESERRLASMFMLGDVCIETMAPAPPVDDATAVGRFLLRNGPGLYAVAFLVDDLPSIGSIGSIGLAEEIPDGARYFVARRRDMGGLRVEFLDIVLSGDPRGDDSITREVEVNLHADDPAAAIAALADTLGGDRVDDTRVRLAGTTFAVSTGEGGVTLADGTFVGFASVATAAGTV
jgi:hypothetical protein